MGTIEYVDGVDDYTAAQATEQGWSAAFTDLVDGRIEGGAANLFGLIVTRSVTSDAEYTLAFALKMDSITVAAPAVVQFNEGSTVHGVLAWNADGTFSIKNNTTTLGTSANLGLAPNTWYHFEFNYKVHESTGSYELRFNSSSVIGPTTNADTRNGGTTGVITVLRLQSPNSLNLSYDDIVVMRGGGFNGDCRVVTDRPTGAGANSAWTATSGATTVVYQSQGSLAAGTGGITVAWPTIIAADDIGLLFVETCGGEPATLSTAAGFVAVPNSPQATGATTSGTQLSVYWCRATGTSMPSPVFSDAGDHIEGIILTFRGCRKYGSPIDVTSGGVKASASGSATVTGVTTTVANTLVVQAITYDLDVTPAAWASGQTNAGLGSITEVYDWATQQGNGGGIAIWTGTRAATGATGDTSVTVTSSINAFMTVALMPNTTANFNAVNDTYQTGDTDYIASSTAGQRDTYTFPTLGVTGTVRAVAISHVSRKDDAGTRLVATVIRDGSSNYDNAATQSLAATYAAQQQITTTDPSTTSAWTVSGVDAREYGIKLDT